MKAIIKRELDAYFHSILGYMFLTFFSMLGGIMFFFNNIVATTTSMTNFFSSIISWSVFFMPILTMRLFADERKTKTEQLLLTAPISIKEIVLGKFLGAFLMFMCSVLIFLIYPIVIGIYSTLPIAETVGCFVGFILFGGAVISIGAFMSSITESQITAAISTYAVMLVLVLIQSLAGGVASQALQKVLLWFSLIDRFDDFTAGILNVESIVFYLSITSLMLYFTVRVFEKRRVC